MLHSKGVSGVQVQCRIYTHGLGCCARQRLAIVFWIPELGLSGLGGFLCQQDSHDNYECGAMVLWCHITLLILGLWHLL